MRGLKRAQVLKMEARKKLVKTAGKKKKMNSKREKAKESKKIKEVETNIENAYLKKIIYSTMCFEVVTLLNKKITLL